MSSTDPAPFVPASDGPTPPSSTRLFGSGSFRKLWAAQVISSLGDWIGLVAIIALAARVSKGNEAAVGLVMAARMVPGFFFAPVGGVLVDRWDRRKTMVVCDLSRAAIVSMLPFINTLAGLFLASFLLELFTLLWSPAKEATVPNLVPPSKLAAANSLSLAAAYGTFPFGTALFALLAEAANRLSRIDALHSLSVDRESLALWFDATTYLMSGLLILSLNLPEKARRSSGGRIDWGQTWRELLEGLKFIRSNSLVRSVMIGLGVGLIGCGAVVPLGPIYVNQVLGSGTAGFGLLMTGLGVGAAVGVGALSAVVRRLPSELIFVGAIFVTGVGLVLATSVSELGSCVVLTGVFGMGAGVSYVSGFTVIQMHVSDELRGRTFATLYTLIRFCLLVSLAVSPWMAGLLDQISGAVFDGRVIDIGVRVAVPGVRLAFWFGGLVTVAVSLIISRDMLRAHRSRTEASEPPPPAPSG